MKILFVTHASYTSFHRITDIYVKYLRRNQIYVKKVVDEIPADIQDYDVVVYHPAWDLFIRLGKPKQAKLFVGFDVSDTDLISESFANVLNQFDLIITPTEFSRYGMRRGGVYVPIEVIHHGAEADPKIRPKALGYYIASHQEQFYRKGTDISLALMDKLQYPSFVKHYNKVMSITFPPHVKEVDDVKKLYENAGIFILPSRGGAFELPALEAFLHGNIPILPENPIFSYVPAVFVKSIRVKVLLPYPLSEVQIGYGYEANIDDYIKKINEVYDNYDKYAQRYVELAKKYAPFFTWDRVVEKFINTLNLFL